MRKEVQLLVTRHKLLWKGGGWRSTPPLCLPLDTNFETTTCLCEGGPYHEQGTPKWARKSHTLHSACSIGTRPCDIGHAHKGAERDLDNASSSYFYCKSMPSIVFGTPQ